MISKNISIYFRAIISGSQIIDNDDGIAKIRLFSESRLIYFILFSNLKKMQSGNKFRVNEETVKVTAQTETLIIGKDQSYYKIVSKSSQITELI